MEYGICKLCVIPIREEPSERSEMISQVLFGECLLLKEYFMGWYYVSLCYDKVEGWVDSRMVQLLSERKFKLIEAKPQAVCTNIFNLTSAAETQLMIVAGSSLPLWRPYKKEFSLGEEYFKIKGEHSYKKIKDRAKFIASHALLFYNAPHVSGGRSPMGIDASGIIQVVFKMAQIKLPRTTSEQVQLGEAIAFAEESKSGDIAFFQDDNGEVNHAGIIIEKNKIIHISGSVRIDNYDQYGIYDKESKQYTHNLRVIKRHI